MYACIHAYIKSPLLLLLLLMYKLLFVCVNLLFLFPICTHTHSLFVHIYEYSIVYIICINMHLIGYIPTLVYTADHFCIH